MISITTTQEGTKPFPQDNTTGTIHVIGGSNCRVTVGTVTFAVPNDDFRVTCKRSDLTIYGGGFTVALCLE